MGEGVKTLRGALEQLNDSGAARVVACSAIYQTSPISDVKQDDFLNAVVELQTGLRPPGLLGLLLETEQHFGRERGVKWGPRTLDLDLLFFDDVVESMPGLEIPHPEIMDRGFVLVPMAEIAANFVHPVTGRTMQELHGEWRGRVGKPEALVRRLEDCSLIDMRVPRT